MLDLITNIEISLFTLRVEIIFMTVFFLVLFIGATIDKLYYILPDEGMYILLIFGLLRIFIEDLQFINRLVTFIFTICIYVCLYYISSHGFGMGDIKWLAAISLWFNLPEFFLVNLLAFTIGTIYIILSFILLRPKRILPFGPFIAISCALTYFFGGKILWLYEKYLF